MQWYLKAANQGYAEASYRIGQMYAKGLGVDKDYKMAHEWLTKAAEKDHGDAAYQLGLFYENGHGVINYSRSLTWYTKAANCGNVDAQYNVGIINFYGKGIQKDYTEALHWLEKVANCKSDVSADAQNHIGLIYLDKQHGNNDDLFDSERNCYIKPFNDMEKLYSQSNNGNVKPLYRVKRDYKEAFKSFTRSANNDYPSSCSNLGYLYIKGYGTEKDYSRGLVWFMRAIDRGGSLYHIIGSIYLYGGNHVTQDSEKALDWFTKGLTSEDFSADSQFGMGELYSCSNYEERDNEKAFLWYKQAAENGGRHAVAQLKLGQCYQEGIGIDQDFVEAMTWYQKSAANSCQEARMYVDLLTTDNKQTFSDSTLIESKEAGVEASSPNEKKVENSQLEEETQKAIKAAEENVAKLMAEIEMLKRSASSKIEDLAIRGSTATAKDDSTTTGERNPFTEDLIQFPEQNKDVDDVDSNKKSTINVLVDIKND